MPDVRRGAWGACPERCSSMCIDAGRPTTLPVEAVACWPTPRCPRDMAHRRSRAGVQREWARSQITPCQACFFAAPGGREPSRQRIRRCTSGRPPRECHQSQSRTRAAGTGRKPDSARNHAAGVPVSACRAPSVRVEANDVPTSVRRFVGSAVLGHRRGARRSGCGVERRVN
jgi:hypothetical protein